MSLDEDLVSAVKARNEARERYNTANRQKAMAGNDYELSEFWHRKGGAEYRRYERASDRAAELLQGYGLDGFTLPRLRRTRED